MYVLLNTLGSRIYYVTLITRRHSEDSEPCRIAARRCQPCWLGEQIPSECCAPVTVTYRIVPSRVERSEDGLR